VPAVICAYCEERRAFYRNLQTFAHFGKAWLSRVDKTQQLAMHLWAVSVAGVKNTPDTPRKNSLNPLFQRTANILWNVFFDLYRSV
jgi:lysozyme family protein